MNVRLRLLEKATFPDKIGTSSLQVFANNLEGLKMRYASGHMYMNPVSRPSVEAWGFYQTMYRFSLQRVIYGQPLRWV